MAKCRLLAVLMVLTVSVPSSLPHPQSFYVYPPRITRQNAGTDFGDDEINQVIRNISNQFQDPTVVEGFDPSAIDTGGFYSGRPGYGGDSGFYTDVRRTAAGANVDEAWNKGQDYLKVQFYRPTGVKITIKKPYDNSLVYQLRYFLSVNRPINSEADAQFTGQETIPRGNSWSFTVPQLHVDFRDTIHFYVEVQGSEGNRRWLREFKGHYQVPKRNPHGDSQSRPDNLPEFEVISSINRPINGPSDQVAVINTDNRVRPNGNKVPDPLVQYLKPRGLRITIQGPYDVSYKYLLKYHVSVNQDFNGIKNGQYNGEITIPQGSAWSFTVPGVRVNFLESVYYWVEVVGSQGARNWFQEYKGFFQVPERDPHGPDYVQEGNIPNPPPTNVRPTYNPQPQTPPNYFNQPQTPPNYYTQPQTPPNYYTQPQTPQNYYTQPQTPPPYNTQPQTRPTYANKPQNRPTQPPIPQTQPTRSTAVYNYPPTRGTVERITPRPNQLTTEKPNWWTASPTETTTQRPPRPVTIPQCQPSSTIYNNGKRPCVDQVVQELFKFQPVVQIAGIEPEDAFTIFISDNVVASGHKYSSIKVSLLENKYGEHFVDQNLTLPGCTAIDRTLCSAAAAGHFILPPVLCGRQTTSDSFHFRYGVLEVTAKLPRGDWVVPELWLEPKYRMYGAASGRIVLAKTRGNNELYDGVEDYSNRVLEAGVELGSSSKQQLFKISQDRPWTDEYHKFMLVWMLDSLIFFVDDREIGRVTPGVNGLNPSLNAGKLSPFDQEFYLVVGAHVGGNKDFPDTLIGKPWKNFHQKNKLLFWRDRNKWQSSWDQNTALHIAAIKLTALSS